MLLPNSVEIGTIALLQALSLMPFIVFMDVAYSSNRSALSPT